MKIFPRKKTFFGVSIFLLALLALTFPVLPNRSRAEGPADSARSEGQTGEPRSQSLRIAKHERDAAFAALKPAVASNPHVLPASYYSLRGNLSATLTLNNKGPAPLDVQPTLFSLNGRRLDVPPVTVGGTSFRVIDLHEWAIPGGGFDEGSLQVMHFGDDMQLGAQVKIIDAEHSLIFDEQMMAMMAMSSRLEGVVGYDINWGWYWCGNVNVGIVKLASLNAQVRRDSVTLNGLSTPEQWPPGIES